MHPDRSSLAFNILREREARRSHAISELQRIAVEFPDILDEFLRATGMLEVEAAGANGSNNDGLEPVPVKRAGRKPRSGTAYQNVVRVFMERKNDWTATSEITARSGVARNAVAHILWSAHKNDFEQQPHQTHKRMKIWRMKPEALDRAKDQQRMFQSRADNEEQ
jgi:hypothetical protein